MLTAGAAFSCAIATALLFAIPPCVLAQNNWPNEVPNSWPNQGPNQGGRPVQPTSAAARQEALITMGKTAFEARDYARALQSFYQFEQERPTNIAVHFWLGTTLSAMGRTSDAEKEYEESLRQAASLGWDGAELRTNLANTLLRQGFLKEPLFDYQRAVLINPRSPEAHLGLAKCLIEQGNFDQALMSLDSYQKAGGQDINAILLHGLALAGKDQYAPAKQDLTTFLNAAQNGASNQPLDQNLSCYKEKYVTTGSANQGAIDLARRILDEMQHRN